MPSVVSHRLGLALWASTRRLLSVPSTHAGVLHKPALRQHQPAHRPPQASLSLVQVHHAFPAQQEFEDLIAAIRECDDERALSELVGQRVRDFSPAHTAAAFRRLAIICRLDKARPQQARTEEPSTPVNRTLASWAARNSVVAIKEAGWSVPMGAQRRDVLHHLGLRVLEVEGELRAREVACTLWALGSMNVVAGRNQLVEVLTRRLRAVARALSPLQLSSTLWALARIGGTGGRARLDAEMLEAVTLQVLLKAPLFQPQEVANTLWALAKMGGAGGTAGSGAVVGAVGRRAGEVAGRFNGQQLASTLWALARLHMPPALLPPLLAHAAPIAARFSPQEWSNAVWALGRMAQAHAQAQAQAQAAAPEGGSSSGPRAWAGAAVPAAVMRAVVGRGLAVAPLLRAEELAMALAGLARLLPAPSPHPAAEAAGSGEAGWEVDGGLVAGLAGRAAAVARGLAPHAVAPSLWALARLTQHARAQAGGVAEGAVAEAVARVAERGVEAGAAAGMSRHEAADALWALARLQPPHTHPAGAGESAGAGAGAGGWEWALGEEVVRRLLPMAGRVSGSEAAAVLWALARLLPAPPPRELQGEPALLVRALEARALQLAGAGRMGAQGVVQSLVGVAWLGRGREAGAVVRGLAGAAGPLAPAMTPRHLANLWWALGRLAHLPPHPTLLALYDRTLLLCHRFQPQEVSNILWGVARLALRPPPPLLHALCRHAARQAGGMTSQGVGNVLWAAACLEPCPAFTPLLHALAHHGGVGGGRLRGVHAAQAFQFLLSARLHPPLKALIPPNLAEELRAEEAGWRVEAGGAAVGAAGSGMQRAVAHALRSHAGLLQAQEGRVAGTAYSADLVLAARHPLAPPEARAAPAGWLLEVDGPPHFLQGTRVATGATELKRRHLRALGYHLVSVPYWEWDSAHQWGGRGAYLARKLELLAAPPPAWTRPRPRPPSTRPAAPLQLQPAPQGPHHTEDTDRVRGKGVQKE